MIRRELFGMVAALALATFSGLKAGTEASSPKPSACGCCGVSCVCPGCTCDAELAVQAEGCACCGGSACCSARQHTNV